MLQRLVAAGVLSALNNCRLIDLEPEDAPAWAAVRRAGAAPTFTAVPSQRLRHHQVRAHENQSEA